MDILTCSVADEIDLEAKLSKIEENYNCGTYLLNYYEC